MVARDVHNDARPWIAPLLLRRKGIRIGPVKRCAGLTRVKIRQQVGLSNLLQSELNQHEGRPSSGCISTASRARSDLGPRDLAPTEGPRPCKGHCLKAAREIRSIHGINQSALETRAPDELLRPTCSSHANELIG